MVQEAISVARCEPKKKCLGFNEVLNNQDTFKQQETDSYFFWERDGGLRNYAEYTKKLSEFREFCLIINNGAN